MTHPTTTCFMRYLFALLSFAISTTILSADSPPRLGLKSDIVSWEATPGSFPLIQNKSAASIFLDSADYPAVLRAAGNLQGDIERVTATKPQLISKAQPSGKSVVIAGTLGKSSLIDSLVKSGKINASAIAGKWESFMIVTVSNPLPGVEQALIIAGSDMRGTIYGLYELSSQIGVSPWYWWADVPVQHRDALYVKAGTYIQEPPVVKYRGIFLNDEAPALTNWSREKFEGFNHQFYAHVFELILRLRGNYIWPAMWGSAFYDDDPLNAQLASDYGIVMGTSHHEPMMRAHDEWRRFGKGGAWNYNTNAAGLKDFWRAGMERVRDREQIVTIGMRGDGDEPMSLEANTALLERIVDNQRQIISEVTGREADKVPQLWALYKEVQEYYEKGMRVPDDVTLLWCDDNWGNIRRLPTASERMRSGGAGIYYHFDYVGGPRNYKWLNTVTLPQIHEQMRLAWQYGADRIWIVNVGDLKPVEYPIEFFLTMAWNPAALEPTAATPDPIKTYSHAWAARNFGGAFTDPRQIAEVADLIDGYARLNNRRKPELISPDTYSFVNYDEADRVLAEWRDLTARTEKLWYALTPPYQDAFFQLVSYPILASSTAQELYLAAGLNHLYKRQGRSDTNDQAKRVSTLFAEDGALSDLYHTIGNGKWNHMMDQIRLGYTMWQQPDIAATPALFEVRPVEAATPAMAIEGTEVAFPSYGAPPPKLPPLDGFAKNTRRIELFNRGAAAYTFKATSNQPWLKLTPAAGTIDKTEHIEVSVDWSAAPTGNTSAKITITPSAGAPFFVTVPVYQPDTATRQSALNCFVETDGHIAIEASHFSRTTAPAEAALSWKVLPHFGRTLGAVTPLLSATPSNPEPVDANPTIEYDIFFQSTGEFTTELYCAPSLDFDPDKPLQVAVSFDNAPPQILRLDTSSTLKDWERAVADNIIRLASKHHITSPGRHILKIQAITPGVVVERIVINTGGLRPSYLGPQESPREQK